MVYFWAINLLKTKVHGVFMAKNIPKAIVKDMIVLRNKNQKISIVLEQPPSRTHTSDLFESCESIWTLK